METIYENWAPSKYGSFRRYHESYVKNKEIINRDEKKDRKINQTKIDKFI